MLKYLKHPLSAEWTNIKLFVKLNVFFMLTAAALNLGQYFYTLILMQRWSPNSIFCCFDLTKVDHWTIFGQTFVGVWHLNYDNCITVKCSPAALLISSQIVSTSFSDSKLCNLQTTNNMHLLEMYELGVELIDAAS